MALHCQFAGDPSEKNGEAEAVLRARYDSGLAVHHVNLHHTIGRGHGVISATRTPPTGGACRRGERFKLPEPEDISAEVRQVLRDAGIPVWE